MIQLLILFLLLIVIVFSQGIQLFDYQPTESFLNVYLNIYDMDLVHPTHSVRINQVLGNFEIDPEQFYNDEICFDIVIEEIIMGFRMESGIFFERSRRLLTRILQSNPGRNVFTQMLFLLSVANLPEVVHTVFNYYHARNLVRNPLYEILRNLSSPHSHNTIPRSQ